MKLTKEIIDLTNRANLAAKQYGPILFEELKKFKGKAFKVDGSRTKAFKEFYDAAFIALNTPEELGIRLHCSSYSVRVDFQIGGASGTFYNDGSSQWHNAEMSIYMGNISDQGISWEMAPVDGIKTDYDLEVIKAAYKAREELEKKAREIEAAYSRFGQNLYF